MGKKFTIRKKLYLLATVFCLIFISLQIITFLYSKNIKKNWNTFDNVVETKMSLLSIIKDDFGYGGAIHSYKNYLIRNENKYLETFNKKYNQFIKHKNEYLHLEDISLFEINNLKEIESIFLKYKINSTRIKELLYTNKSIKYIDTIVKIDDSTALRAMKNLNLYYKNIRHNKKPFN